MNNGLYEKKKPSILIVDDSLLTRSQLSNFLTQEGYEVFLAENGKDAILLFESIKPDIVLLDYIMPGMDGPQTCIELGRLNHWSNAKIFMITSASDVDSVNKAYEAGSTDYITKPVNLAVLRQRLRLTIESQEALKELRHNNAFSNSIINYAVEGIVTLSEDRKIRYVNPSTLNLLKYNESELIGKDLNFIIPDFQIYLENFEGTVDSLIDNVHETESLDSTGGAIPIELTASKFYVDESCYFTLIIRDITERKAYEEKIKFQAFYDSLTGLPNRVLLKEKLSSEMTRVKRNNTKFALLYIDLDRFKSINDTLGHDRGDELLKIMSERLRHVVREDDMVVRMGGDEFVIVLAELTNVEYVGKISTKILSSIKDPVDIDGHIVYLTASIGITIFPDDATDYETLLSNADIAMYRAKEKGKNNFQTFTSELNTKAVERLELENSLRRAIEFEEFVVHYQPKINTQTSEIVGMEALVRWQHPKLGLLSPMKFIPLAEDTGLIIEIGEWVLRTSCIDNKALQNAGFPHLSVAVNLSMRQFEIQNLVEVITNILEETGLDPIYLELEITESIAMKNVEYTVRVIKELQKIGVKFSIDDFGTGYSSLSHITNLSVNKLKIDKSFINMIDGHEGNTIIASTVMALGRNLNMQIVAEGVENITQVEFLKGTDCDEMQGYFIAMPMPKDEFRVMFKESLKA